MKKPYLDKVRREYIKDHPDSELAKHHKSVVALHTLYRAFTRPIEKILEKII